DAAMVPLENSVEGSVNATLDELATGDPLIVLREVLLPVNFALLARPGTELEKVRRGGAPPPAGAPGRGGGPRPPPPPRVDPAARRWVHPGVLDRRGRGVGSRAGRRGRRSDCRANRR